MGDRGKDRQRNRCRTDQYEEGGKEKNEFNVQSKWSEIWFTKREEEEAEEKKKMLRRRADIFPHFLFHFVFCFLLSLLPSSRDIPHAYPARAIYAQKTLTGCACI